MLILTDSASSLARHAKSRAQDDPAASVLRRGLCLHAGWQVSSAVSLACQALTSGPVVVAEDGMRWRVGRQLLEYARHADVAGVRHRW